MIEEEEEDTGGTDQADAVNVVVISTSSIAINVPIDIAFFDDDWRVAVASITTSIIFSLPPIMRLFRVPPNLWR